MDIALTRTCWNYCKRTDGQTKRCRRRGQAVRLSRTLAKELLYEENALCDTLRFGLRE